MACLPAVHWNWFCGGRSKPGVRLDLQMTNIKNGFSESDETGITHPTSKHSLSLGNGCVIFKPSRPFTFSSSEKLLCSLSLGIQGDGNSP